MTVLSLMRLPIFQRRQSVCILGFLFLLSLSAGLHAAEPAGLDWGSTTGTKPPAPWTAQFHPKIKTHTEFELQASPEGASWLQVSADKSYGSWVYVFPKDGLEVQELAWQWRVAQHPREANLRQKTGDDAAVKVCVFVAVDEQKIGLGNRIKLGAARTVSGEFLPAATLCYVWADVGGQALLSQPFANPFTDRVRNWVLRAQPAGDAALREKRNITEDVRLAFGAELPDDGRVRLLGIAVGGDADNTQSKSLAFVRGLMVRIRS